MKELRNGKSKKIICDNMKLLIENGFTEQEALKIAHSKAQVKLKKRVFQIHQFERAFRNSLRQCQG